MTARLVLLLVLISSVAGSSGLATISTGDITFSIDTAVFRLGSGDSAIVEVYQSLSVDQFASVDSFVEFETDLVLLGSAGDTVGVRQWVSQVEWTEGRSVVNGALLLATPGAYSLDVVVTDLANGRRGTASRPLVIELPRGLSDLEVANTLVPATEGSENPLRKGGVIVFPAADGLFDLPGEGRVYLYAEIYDLGGRTVWLQSRLRSAAGDLLFARPWSSLGIPEGVQSAGVLDSLDLGAARASGLHYVELSIVPEGGDTLLVSKPIMIARDIQVQGQADSLLAAAGDRFLDQFRLLLSPEQQTMYDGLIDDEARARYYDDYWSSREADRPAFEDNCRQSSQFSTAFRQGWRTDRGRVWIIFGPPEDIERNPFSIEGFPYEIWYYYETGNDIFVFMDREGSGNYMQIYSTVEGEVSYPDWEEMLQPVYANPSSE
jgi:GWxTD domain-containing protein